MENFKQLTLFPDELKRRRRKKRSGTFVDNMKLPVHRWFRYSAGFSAEWVENLIIEHQLDNAEATILDPFAGSGTTQLAADWVGATSIGIEAHPFVARIAKIKLLWPISPDALTERAYTLLEHAKKISDVSLQYPKLIRKCFQDDALGKLDKLRQAWEILDDGSEQSQLVWLALTAILRSASSAGTAQWQYILPNKTKKVVAEPFEAFGMQIEQMQSDMRLFQNQASLSRARISQADARHFPQVSKESVDLVVTSPPYANNYDYADATRFEMSFWGEVTSWSDLHDAVRKYLIRSSSQHTRKEKAKLESLLQNENIAPIRQELTRVCTQLAEERLLHGGKKHYHTMIAAYFNDMAKVWCELRRVCKVDTKVCFVIGDSAPYGIYVPVEKWLGELAIAAGFDTYHFEKLRDRNVKWKNRTHTVPLHEGRLWVQ